MWWVHWSLLVRVVERSREHRSETGDWQALFHSRLPPAERRAERGLRPPVQGAFRLDVGSGGGATRRACAAGRGLLKESLAFMSAVLHDPIVSSTPSATGLARNGVPAATASRTTA